MASMRKLNNATGSLVAIFTGPKKDEMEAENTSGVQSLLSARAKLELDLLISKSRGKNVKFVMIQTLLLVEAITSADGQFAFNVQMLAGAIIFIMIVYVGYMLIVEQTGDATLTALPKMDMVFTNLLTGLTAIRFFGYNQNIDIGLIFLAIALFMDDLFSTSEGIEAAINRAAITNTEKSTIKVAMEDNLYTNDDKLEHGRNFFSAITVQSGGGNDDLETTSWFFFLYNLNEKN